MGDRVSLPIRVIGETRVFGLHTTQSWFSAISMALSRPRALFTVSSYSAEGTLS